MGRLEYESRRASEIAAEEREWHKQFEPEDPDEAAKREWFKRSSVRVLSVIAGETLAQMLGLPLEYDSYSQVVSSARVVLEGRVVHATGVARLIFVRVALGGKELPRPIPVVAYSRNIFTGETLTVDTAGVSFCVLRGCMASSIVPLEDMTDVRDALGAAGLPYSDFSLEVEQQLSRSDDDDDFRYALCDMCDMVWFEIDQILDECSA